MVKKAIFAIVFNWHWMCRFFLVYEEDQKMSQEILSEESSGEQAVETKDVRIYWTNRSGSIRRIRSDNMVQMSKTSSLI